MANNGQNMASLNANSMFYNMTTAVAMLAGRFGLAAFALALAGRFAAQRQWLSPKCRSAAIPLLSVSWFLERFCWWGALSFLPALALGPIAEALQR